MSLKNKMNSTGPKTDPWGTPDTTGLDEERTPLTETLCVITQKSFNPTKHFTFDSIKIKFGKQTLTGQSQMPRKSPTRLH